MTVEQMAHKSQARLLTPDDVRDSIITVAERFLDLWRGDAEAAKVSLYEMGVNGRLANMLCLAMDTIQRRRQRQLNFELGGCRIRRGRFWAVA